MTRILSAGLAGLLFYAVPAFAQMTRVPGPMRSQDGQRAAPARKPAEPPPAGVPGARAEPDLVAPAERVPTDMPPTEALFDAINRGDLNGSKEAIGRGADIHGRNVLGLTPVELSVDLGRNDISFLLLSLRGGAGYNPAGRPGTAAESRPAPVDRQTARRAEQQARRQEAAAQRSAGHAATRVPAQPRTARLFAGDGGAPVPQAGFLGFDSAR
jgi:hypothetical protein